MQPNGNWVKTEDFYKSELKKAINAAKHARQMANKTDQMKIDDSISNRKKYRGQLPPKSS